MGKVSVLIPSRNEPFLLRTVQEIFDKAAGDVEVVVTLDGAPAVEPLPEDSRLTVLYNPQAVGIGAAMTAMACVATGDYIFKLDAHCALAEGFDEVLQADCDYDWLVVPARYQLLDETWTCGRGPIHYLYLTYPYLCEPQFGCGMHGKKWLGDNGLEGRYFHREKRDAHILIDDIITFQGSCYFMHRARFLELGGIDAQFVLHQEAATIGMKTWMSGGRCVRNKKTWYAHLHKGSRHGRGYFVSKQYSYKANKESADCWMFDQWQHPLKVRDMHWFVDHFGGIPGWPEDWDDPKYAESFVWPT